MTSPHTRLRITISSRLACALGIGAAALLCLLPTAGAAGTPKQLQFPRSYVLTNDKIGHWAVVVRPVDVHAKPNASSKVVTKLSTVTGDGTQNLVLILDGVDLSPSVTWYHVRLPILPNNSTGWVPRSALGNLYIVHTHLYVNREAETATLKRDGRTIFETRVGVGKSSTPTPAGQFYIRDKLTKYANAFYGPIAFGTSARSAVLTEWPGGGFVGVHGTNEPQLIPGKPSHGCVRLVNSAIVHLARLMQVGSPVTIT